VKRKSLDIVDPPFTHLTWRHGLFFAKSSSDKELTFLALPS